VAVLSRRQATVVAFPLSTSESRGTDVEELIIMQISWGVSLSYHVQDSYTFIRRAQKIEDFFRLEDKIVASSTWSRIREVLPSRQRVEVLGHSFPFRTKRLTFV
jgi:hypothetical protein